MLPRSALGLWLLATCSTLGATAQTTAGRPAIDLPTADHTRAEFSAVCESLRSGHNPYFGDALARRLEQRLAQPIEDPQVALGVRGRLAEDLLRLGRTEEALGRLAEASDIAEAHGAPAEIRQRVAFLRGVGEMRRAEEVNCVAMHGASSCILPLGDAPHGQPIHARHAAKHFLDVLAIAPDDPQARWLLGLARQASGDGWDGVPEALHWSIDADHPSTPGSTPGWPGKAWRNVAPDLGVDAVDLGGGAVVDDFDGDGWLDIVSSTFDPCGPLKAFRNDGRGGFDDVSQAWGLDGQLGGLNLVHADYDGDGRLDLLVLRGGWLGADGRIRNSLLRNDLGGPTDRFLDVTAAAGLAYPAYPTQTAAWADFDLDGDLDLYVGNETAQGEGFSWQLDREPGRPYPSQLFRNNGPGSGGHGTFTDVARAAGVDNLRFAKGVAWGDYDDDGDPDLFVSNIGPNRLYRNDSTDGRARFVDVAASAGVTEPSGLSFATWFFDYDHDGDLDLFVAEYGARMRTVTASYFGEPTSTGGHPRLYRNDGGHFEDVSQTLGLTRPLLPMGANFGDLDGDGWLDLFLGTGVPNLEALMPNAVYRNLGGHGGDATGGPAAGGASRFVDVTVVGGFGHLQKGHGVSFADFDHDGDQDVFHQMGGAYPSDAFANALYENPSPGHAWIVLELEGTAGQVAGGANRFGVGARVELIVPSAAQEGAPRSIHRVVGSGGSFGGSPMRLGVGLGSTPGPVTVVVRWPSRGAAPSDPTAVVQRFEGLMTRRAHRLRQGSPQPIERVLEPITLGSNPESHP